MRKEAKIGLAIIFVLLVIFGMVVYNRLTGGDDPGSATAESDLAASESQTMDGSEAREASPASTSGPTILPAKSGSDDAGGKSLSGTLDGWPAAADDRQEPTSDTGGSSPSSRFSYMPEPVVVPPSGAYGGYGTGGYGASATGTRQMGQAGSRGSTESPYLYGSRQQQGTLSGGGTSRGETPEGVQSISPQLPGTARSGVGLPFGQQSTGRYSSAMQPSTAQQPNPLRDQSGTGGSLGDTAQATPYSYGNNALQSPIRAGQDGTDPSRMSGYGNRSYSAYGAAADPSGAAGQADVSGGASGAAGLNQQQDPSTGASSAGSVGQRWSHSGATAQSDSGSQYLSSQGSNALERSRASRTPDSPGKEGKYVVQPNDNYWVISQKLYGTGAYFRALAHHNRSAVPNENQLPVGQQIAAPDAGELERAYPDLCPKPEHRTAAQKRTSLVSSPSRVGTGRVYVVQKGDTLYDIAKYELGKPSRWVEIIKLNRDLLGGQIDYLTPGMKLVLPDDESAGTVTRRSDPVYQR